MKYISIVALLISGSLMAAACSSSSSSTDEKPVEMGNTKVGSATTNSNAVVVANGTEVQPPPQTADANAATATSSDPLQRPRESVKEKMDKMRKSGESGPPPDPAQLARQNSRPAPENSTFTSYLTDAAFEVRTFNNHPQLLKVEKKITSDGKQTLKVFLRNGKVVEVPAQSISPIATAPTSVILQTAGVQPPPAAPPGTAPTKKGE